MGKHRSKKAINNQKQFLDISYRDLNDEQFYRIIKNHPFLKILVCSNNQITNLDYLPPTLQELYCANNPLINKLNNTDLYIKRSNWLRFRRDKHNEACERKTRAYLILREIRNTSQFYENCLPHCIIRHIVDFI